EKEAFGLVALEAMACGVPVIGSDAGGLPEIVDDSVGGLFEPADAKSLSDKVVDLLTSSDLEVKGRRARERVVAHWSNERLADRHVEIYESVLAERGEG
ncbi:MAG: glycosyltransferase family 4 protein, partial [Gemmatimonadetes bacterium]|nr:glycosyltransferase family 4 protein [Gemmatimonadota bacterium]